VRVARLIAAVIAFLLIMAIVIALVVLSSNNGNEVHLEQVVKDTVNEQVQGVKDLIDQNTQ
jgi:hypothetical protein